MPLFQRRHYNFFAKELKDRQDHLDYDEWEDWVDWLAGLFAADNPNFSRARFEDAANKDVGNV